jgi:integrase/recombinase XerD
MTVATAAVSPLRRRMIDDMSLRNLSPATQRSYIHAVKRFSRFHGRSPDQLGLEDVRAFQVYLVSQGISWPALNQTVCALRFFYGVTLDRAEIPERIACARTPRKLPDILSADEVVRFLEAVPSPKCRFVQQRPACRRASHAERCARACTRVPSRTAIICPL